MQSQSKRSWGVWGVLVQVSQASLTLKTPISLPKAEMSLQRLSPALAQLVFALLLQLKGKVAQQGMRRIRHADGHL